MALSVLTKEKIAARPAVDMHSRLLYTIRTTPTDSMEIFLALASLAYGLWFVSFSDALTFPAYRRLDFPILDGGAHLAWGVGLILLSGAELLAIEADLKVFRRLLPYVMLLLWGWVAMLMFSPHHHDPPIVSASFRALAAAWVIWRNRGTSNIPPNEQTPEIVSDGQ